MGDALLLTLLLSLIDLRGWVEEGRERTVGIGLIDIDNQPGIAMLLLCFCRHGY